MICSNFEIIFLHDDDYFYDCGCCANTIFLLLIFNTRKRLKLDDSLCPEKSQTRTKLIFRRRKVGSIRRSLIIFEKKLFGTKMLDVFSFKGYKSSRNWNKQINKSSAFSDSIWFDNFLYLKRTLLLHVSWWDVKVHMYFVIDKIRFGKLLFSSKL